MRFALSPESSAVAPGGVVELLVTIGNDGDQVLTPALVVHGVDPNDVAMPSAVRLAPGEVVSAVVEVRVPAGATGGTRRISVGVSDPDGLHPAALLSAAISVGAAPDIAVELSPAASSGRGSAKLLTLLHNRSDAPLEVSLAGGGADVDVAFAADEVVVPPGEDVEIATRIDRLRRAWFRERRHAALVEVRGDGAPVTAAATFRQLPFFPVWLVRTVAFVTVFAVWAAAVVVVHDRMTSDPIDREKIYALGAAAAEARAAGDGARGDAADDVDAETVALAGAPVVVHGLVDGPAEPAGTDVVIERIAYGDEGTTDGGEVKLAALTSLQAPKGVVVDRSETSTDARGSFRFSSGLAVPAFYRVTARRAGFEVASQVVQTSEEQREIELAMSLVPATAAMAGRVTDTGGSSIGGAEVTITDGNLVYTTSSATEGQVGTWSLSGIAAPAIYQVTVSQRGYSTATLIVGLEGGEELTGVDAELTAGLGTIRGRVTHRGEGVGAVTVDLVGNPTERTTTTLTDGDLAGTFDFPALAFGTYQLTFSGPGWLTQTSEVVVDRGDVQITVSDLRPSTAAVQGVVHQEVAPGGGCRYPDPDVPSQRDDAQLRPCGGAGVSVVGDDQVWSTTTATGDGSFRISGIPPGEHQVRVEQFGYLPQYYDLTVAPGDVLTLPAAAGGRSGAAIELRLLPLVDAASGEVQGVLRDATDPTTPFDPPAGTVIGVDGQPDAAVELLNAGAFRITGLRPGAHTLRIEVPGYDVRTEVVRVAFDTPVDTGAIAITPLGSLALRITGGQASVVGEAEVFVVPDPAVYGPHSGRRVPNVEPAGDVTTCERSFHLDDQDWTLDGVCATTDVVGDVEFRHIFGTGNYVMVTPVNLIDAADDIDSRASTVALDHERLVRRVDMTSGQTTRLDLSLRRYPIITGTVLRPASVGDGLEPVYNVERDDITFERIDANGNVLPLPPGAPTPRISVGEDDGLDPGRYRIDRIPADGPASQNLWRLVISSDGDTFERGPGQPGGPIDGLGFNETRTISAMLLPAPQSVRFELTWEPAGGTGPEPVPGARLQLSGISGFDVLDVQPFFVPIQADCPGPLCRVQLNEGEVPFDFRAPITDPRVGTFGGAAWLFAGVAPHDVAGTFTMPPFFRPGDLEAEVAAPGFTPRSLDIDLESVEDDDFVVEEQLAVLDRDVTGTVQLTPGATFPPFMAELGAANQAELLADLTVTLTGGNGFDATVDLPGSGAFTFDGVAPGYYDLEIDGPRITPQTTSIVVTPGPGAYTLTGAPVTVTRTGFVRIDVRSVLADGGPGGGLEDVTVELERRVSGSGEFAVEQTLTTCEDPDSLGGGPACDLGIATFTELPLFDGSGVAYEYRVSTSRDGYIEEQTPAFHLASAPYVLHQLEMDRFGELRGTLRGQVSDDVSTLTPLEEATVTLVDAATGAPLSPSVDVETDADGAYVFPSELRIPPRTTPVPPVPVCPDACHTEYLLGPGQRYGLSFEAAGYEPLLLPQEGQQPGLWAEEGYTFALNTTVDDVDVVLAALPGNIVGSVSGPPGYVMYDDGEDGIPVTVEVARVDEPDVVLYSTQTGPASSVHGEDLPDGAYAFTGIDAGQYRITFDAGIDFLTQSVDETLAPEQTLRVDDARLVLAPGQLQGTIRSQPFSDADERALQAGVRVTATIEGGTGEVTFTGSDGTYDFPELPPGTYELTFELDGYELGSHGAVLITPNGSTTVHDVLTAEERVVEVTVSSAAAGIDGIEAASVTATYDGPQGSGPAGSPFSLATDEEGEVSFSLPPGDWTIAVSGTDGVTFDPRPHVTPDPQEVAVPLSTDPAPTPDFELTPYVSAYGTLVAMAEDGSTPPAEGVAVTVDDAGALLDPATTGEDGEWKVWLPAPPTGDDVVTVTFTLTGYSVMTDPLEASLYLGDDLDADRGEIELPPLPREVTLVLDSAAGAASIVGLTLEARRTGLSTQTAEVVVDAGAATVTFDGLAPGQWSVSSTNGAHADRLEETGALPHFDLDGVDLDVPLGTEPYEPEGAFVTFAAVTGTVSGLVPDTEDDTEPVVGADVEVAQGGGTIEVSSGSDGGWTVGLVPEVATDVAVSAAGYDVPSGGHFEAEDVAGMLTHDVTLTATERAVRVTVTSATDDARLGGVTVTATSVADDEVSISDTTSSTGPMSTRGRVTFTLPPGEWTFDTTGASGLTPPHVDHGPAVHEIAIGTGQVELAFELVAYITIDGTVQVADFDGAPAEDPPTGTQVTVTQDGETIATTSVDTSDGTWSAMVPPDVATTLAYSATHYGTLTPTAESWTEDTTLEAEILIATPREVTVAVQSEEDDDGTPVLTPLGGATVTATFVRDEDDPAPPDVVEVTAGDGHDELDEGEAVLRLAPGEWDIVASEDGHLEAEAAGEDTVSIVLGEDPEDPVELVLRKNSVLTGQVVEVRGNDRVAVPGVTVEAHRAGETFSTVSTEPDGSGDNYRLRMRPGVWRITAIRDGESILVGDAFEVVKDGEGTTPNRLEIAVPTRTTELSGLVADDAGNPVPGAPITAVSSSGTVVTSSDVEGRYTLADLDNTVTWAVTFAPPDGSEGRPVTRYVALSGHLGVDLTLDQSLPAGLGSIELAITGGEPGTAVAVVLTEATPFPTLNESGHVERSVTLDEQGAAITSFDDLVPGDGRSISQDRFGLAVTAPGHEPLTRTGIDVAPGGTTPVAIDLGLAVAPTRDVIVTLVSEDGPVEGRSVVLRDGGTTVAATVAEDSNVYTFASVVPGEWIVEASGFEPAAIVVAPGTDAFAITVTVTARDDHDAADSGPELDPSDDGWFDDEWPEEWMDAPDDRASDPGSGDGGDDADDADDGDHGDHGDGTTSADDGSEHEEGTDPEDDPGAGSSDEDV